MIYIATPNVLVVSTKSHVREVCALESSSLFCKWYQNIFPYCCLHLQIGTIIVCEHAKWTDLCIVICRQFSLRRAFQKFVCHIGPEGFKHYHSDSTSTYIVSVSAQCLWVVAMECSARKPQQIYII